MTRDNKFYNDPINSDDRRKERLYHLERKVDRLAKAKRKTNEVKKTVYINTGGSGGTPGTLEAHDLGGIDSPHTGTLQDNQAPQFLKTDGSRTLTGSLSVGAGITIDGVDLDVLEDDVDNHLLSNSDDHPGYASAEGASHSRSAKQATKAVAITMISATEPVSPISGMVWVDTNA